MDSLSASLQGGGGVPRYHYVSSDRTRVWKDLHKRMAHIRIEKIKTLEPIENDDAPSKEPIGDTGPK